MKDPFVVIDEFVNDVPSNDWIINESGLPWLELDLDTPHLELFKEIEPLRNKFIPFCGNIPKDSETVKSRVAQGERLNVSTDNVDRYWNFLTLYGISSDVVSYNFDYPHLNNKPINHNFTDVAQSCPVHKKFIEDTFNLDNDILVKYANLGPGGFLTPHTDADDASKLQQKLTSLTLMVKNPEGCIFHYEKWGEMPITEGKFYLINVNYYHATQNRSNEERYHLMFRITNRNKSFNDYFKDKTLIQRSFVKQMSNFKCQVT